MSQKTSAFLSLGLTLFLAASALAAPPVTTEMETSGGAFNAVHVDLWGWSYMPAFGNMNGRTPKAGGVAVDPVEITTQVILSTPLSSKWSLAVVPSFALIPMATNANGQRLKLVNPTVGVQADIVKSGILTYWARYEVVLPVTSSSREEDLLVMAPQAVNVISLREPTSNWELNTTIVPVFNIHTTGQISNFLYVRPEVRYHINDRWFLTLLWEQYYKRDRGRPLGSFRQDKSSNIGLGFRHTFGGGLFVQPFFNVFTSGPLSWNSAHIGFFFGGSVI